MPKRREKKIALKVGVTNDGRELEVGEEYFSSSCDGYVASTSLSRGWQGCRVRNFTKEAECEREKILAELAQKDKERERGSRETKRTSRN